MAEGLRGGFHPARAEADRLVAATAVREEVDDRHLPDGAHPSRPRTSKPWRV